ncbi:uncharacterized protein LOC132550401 [Ylistrum balloti]|uniref:uncharacterized protein LOC132550401 n=1 Tax=Ylistrum balloti TaxID=509963 RepID=UPI002905B1A0|nr:uncharacterized protein LOC132550401 [Ylistrum balloti]
MVETKHRMKKDKDNHVDLYVECWSKFYDADGNSVTLTTTTAGPVTSTTPGGLSTKKPIGAIPNAMVYIIGGAAVLLLLLCMFFIICMVMSRRNRSERRRRKAAEAESSVMKTNLSSITDKEDNYAELSMGDPTYRDGHVELPSRKNRNRLGGVSNGLQTVKRFLSEEGNQPTIAQPYAATREPTRRCPLPAIPETGQKSNSFPRSREQSEKRLSYRNPEYEEIGPDNFRRSHVYNPLESSLKVTGAGRSTYESLRQNTLAPIPGSTRSLTKATNMEDNYFIVEKEGDGYTKVMKDTTPVDGAYFMVEKVTDITFDPRSPDNDDNVGIKLIPSSPQTPGDEDAEKQPMLGTANPEYGKATGGSENNYFLLEKSNGTGPSEADYRDYVQPVDKQRNSYIDILQCHDNFVDRQASGGVI